MPDEDARTHYEIAEDKIDGEYTEYDTDAVVHAILALVDAVNDLHEAIRPTDWPKLAGELLRKVDPQ